LVPVAGAALVIAGGTTAGGWGAEAVLGLAPVKAIGRWSYGMYLWQIPVLLILQLYWGPPRSLPVVSRVALLAVVTAVAAASFVVLESPIRNWRLLASRPVLTLQLAGIAIVVGLCAVTLIGQLH
jgi:peptidoglycan/LPS O-acetylase OafA/YrhL